MQQEKQNNNTTEDSQKDLYRQVIGTLPPIFSNHYLIVSIIIFIVVFLAAIGFRNIIQQEDWEEIKLTTKLTARFTASRLQENTESYLDVIRHLRQEWFLNKIKNKEDFTREALAFISVKPGFQAINYIDPQGIIRWVVPESPNLPALNKDLHKHPEAAESFIQAEQTGKDVATPALTLLQGGKGFATYFPLIREGKVEGYLNGVFRIDNFFSQTWLRVSDENYYLQIYCGENQIYSNVPEEAELSEVTGKSYFLVLNHKFLLILTPQPEFLAHYMNPYLGWLLIIGFILAIVVSVLTYYQLRRQNALHQGLQKIQKSEEQYRQLIEHSPDGICIHQDGNIVFMNEAMKKILKTSKDNPVLDNPFLDIVKPEYHQSTLDRHRTVIEKGVDVGQVEHKYVRQDGKEIDVEVSALPVTHEGRPAAQVVVRDITDRKHDERLKDVVYQISQAASTCDRLEDLFSAIHRALSTILDTSNFYIALYNPEENILSFPFYIDEKDPKPEDSKLGKGLTEYVMNLKRPLLLDKKQIFKLAEEGKIELLGTPSEQWMGAPLIAEGNVIGVIGLQSYTNPNLYTSEDLRILAYASEQIAVTINRERADEKVKISERQYREAAKELSDSNTLKEMLLDVISHDLKNPAGVIQGLADMMLLDNPDDEAIKLIHDSSINLVKILDNAKTLSQLALGEEIATEKLDLSKMISNLIQEFKQILKDHGLDLKLNIPDKLEVVANPIILEIPRNYLTNAIKYASEGKKLELELKQEKNQVIFKLKDFGKTIPAELREEIFGRKVQLENGKKRGRGLGLAIVKRIAEAHGGEAWVEPNKPKGNIFCFSLPLSKSSQDV
jgi:PAS domain S-box-containing protein